MNQKHALNDSCQSVRASGVIGSWMCPLWKISCNVTLTFLRSEESHTDWTQITCHCDHFCFPFFRGSRQHDSSVLLTSRDAHRQHVKFQVNTNNMFSHSQQDRSMWCIGLSIRPSSWSAQKVFVPASLSSDSSVHTCSKQKLFILVRNKNLAVTHGNTHLWPRALSRSHLWRSNARGHSITFATRRNRRAVCYEFESVVQNCMLLKSINIYTSLRVNAIMQASNIFVCIAAPKIQHNWVLTQKHALNDFDTFPKQRNNYSAKHFERRKRVPKMSHEPHAAEDSGVASSFWLVATGP